MATMPASPEIPASYFEDVQEVDVSYVEDVQSCLSLTYAISDV